MWASEGSICEEVSAYIHTHAQIQMMSGSFLTCTMGTRVRKWDAQPFLHPYLSLEAALSHRIQGTGDVHLALGKDALLMHLPGGKYEAPLLLLLLPGKVLLFNRPLLDTASRRGVKGPWQPHCLWGEVQGPC